MKRQSIIACAAVAFWAMVASAAPTLPNTGAGGSTVETNYVLTYAANLSDTPIPVTAQIVTKTGPGLGPWPGLWVDAPSGSQWIGPSFPGVTFYQSPSGYYFYTLSFSIPNVATISGQWATDNSGEIFLNGSSTGITKGSSGYASLDDFAITSGFTGTDTLVFRVWQGPQAQGNPTGLLVTSLVVTVSPAPSPIPTPGGALLASLGAAVVACLRRRQVL
jgi:hypothetical protein